MQESGSSSEGTAVSDRSARPSRGRRLFRAALAEVSELHPRMSLAHGIGHLLPQFSFNRLRTALWRRAGVEIGKRSLVMGDIILSGSGHWPSLLSVGDDTYISGPLRINLGATVRIGNCVNIGHDCVLLTVDHEIATPARRAGPLVMCPIVVEDGVWIASRVTILPGVTVGRGAVIAAGAVVTAHVPPHTLVAGVPGRVLRKLSRSEQ